MIQKTKYIGLLAILPLVMVALSPDFIGQADALGPKDVAAKLKALQEPREENDPFKGHSGAHATEKTIELSSKAIRYAQAAPDNTVELSLTQVTEPQTTLDFAMKSTKGFVPRSADYDTETFRAVYLVQNAGNGDVQNVQISVSSDTETVQAELQGNLDPKHSVISVMIKAADPASINAEIVEFEN